MVSLMTFIRSLAARLVTLEAILESYERTAEKAAVKEAHHYAKYVAHMVAGHKAIGIAAKIKEIVS